MIRLDHLGFVKIWIMRNLYIHVKGPFNLSLAVLETILSLFFFTVHISQIIFHITFDSFIPPISLFYEISLFSLGHLIIAKEYPGDFISTSY